MKKMILACGAALMSIALNAQQLTVGASAGYGHTWFRIYQNPAKADFEFFPALTGALELTYAATPKIAVKSGVQYAAQGANYNYVSNGDKINTEMRANYIRIPLTVEYRFGGTRSVQPVLGVGPNLGFLTSGEKTTWVNGNLNHSEKTKDLVQNTDIGIDMNGGAYFPIGAKAKLSTMINYYHGLANIYRDTQSDIKNRKIGVQVGVHVPIN